MSTEQAEPRPVRTRQTTAARQTPATSGDECQRRHRPQRPDQPRTKVRAWFIRPAARLAGSPRRQASRSTARRSPSSGPWPPRTRPERRTPSGPPRPRAGSAGSARRPGAAGSRSRARPSTSSAARSPGASPARAHRGMFTTLSVPVMTRLRQSERRVLDTLVGRGRGPQPQRRAGLVRAADRRARRCLAGQLREALRQVEEVRDQGPASA